MLTKWMNDLNNSTGWTYAAYVAGVIAVGLILAIVLIIIKRRIFKKIKDQKSGLQISFLESLCTVVIIIMCILMVVSAFGGLDNVWKSLLGGTAVISAILAFAAQDVLKDVLAGVTMSMNKPFEVGNRIELEDGTRGIVEDITLRHVVLKGADTLRVIVPNHKLAAMKVLNYSYKREDKSILFRFSVSYDTDLELAKRLVAESVKESPLTKPLKDDEDGAAYYGPVRFMSFADSALILETMVYYDKSRATEMVTDDINMRVKKKFNENGIEIPYQYVNVITQEPDDGEEQ